MEVSKTDYLRGKELKNGVMESVYHRDGRAVKNGSSWQYEYWLKDHMGNTREIFSDANGDGVITGTERRGQVDYYNYGMEWNGMWSRHENTSPENKYRYNGKEKWDEMALGLYHYGARMMDPILGRFTTVDPLVHKMPGYSPYSYSFNNPIRFIDPDGRFPIDPAFRKAYPQLTSFIENRLQGYIQNSPRMLSALNKYSTGNLTPSQIASDFKSDSGPSLKGHDYGGGVNSGGGEFDKSTNTIKMDNKELSRFESILNNPDATKQKWGEMDFTELFVNEYTHYGDALDGFDAIQDANGNVINSQTVDMGAWGDSVFDEGNAAAAELFPFDTGRQNYMLYKTGDIYSPTSGKPVGSDKTKIDPTMIPPNKP